jgi:CRP-like cAMP-binding protein
MENDLLLNNFRRHVAISDEEAQVIHSHSSERRFKKGEFITKEGEVNRYTNFIEKGSVRVYYIDSSGQEHIIQLGISGWWTGDFPSFISQKKGILYTETLEPTTVLCLSYENLQILYRDVPVLERCFRLLIQNAYASFQYRILQNLSLDAEQRYLAFSEAYPEIDRQISQKHIASYLGMSAEFLSKIKKRIVINKRTKTERL